MSLFVFSWLLSVALQCTFKETKIHNIGSNSCRIHSLIHLKFLKCLRYTRCQTYPDVLRVNVLQVNWWVHKMHRASSRNQWYNVCVRRWALSAELLGFEKVFVLHLLHSSLLSCACEGMLLDEICIWTVVYSPTKPDILQMKDQLVCALWLGSYRHRFWMISDLVWHFCSAIYCC